MAKTTRSLSQLKWTLTGWVPYTSFFEQGPELSGSANADTAAVPARVPGSVQQSLLDAGVIPDWNAGLNSRLCEWVENRHWAYETRIPDEWIQPGRQVRLNCLGLDYSGWIMLNGRSVAEFRGTHTPHRFDLTGALAEQGNVLRIVFDCPPRWLGQFGRTSAMREWKTRFNYFWDWTARLVQAGIWDDILLETSDGNEILDFRCWTETDAGQSKGRLVCAGSAAGSGVVRVTVSRGQSEIVSSTVCVDEFNGRGIELAGIPAEIWWPNMEGEQPLYDVRVQMLDNGGSEQDSLTRRVGFREIRWKPCEGAPAEADPWICSVNGRDVFLQGANWVPIRPNYADITESDYRKRLELYSDIGANILRVWGGAVLERECFYDICDELGIMVWQEFPTSSSSLDSIPPEDNAWVSEAEQIAVSYVSRRQHHPSLIIWCGGNELINTDPYVPLDHNHAMIGRLGKLVARMDPDRRYLPTSPSGPRVHANDADYGKGVHWDVHGPWKAQGDLDDYWKRYWDGDDALFRSETGSPGASPVDIIRRFQGGCEPMPVSADNPFWKRTFTWWIENEEFARENGRQPETLEEYVEWSRARQARALSIAAESAKRRFPRCGGMIIWMGHDCYPCAANTSIIDFDGNPKPAALALKQIWRSGR